MESLKSHEAVVDVLRDLIAAPVLPSGARGRLFAAYDRLVQTGDIPRAQICGSASVALLKLEHALRLKDEAQIESHSDTLKRVIDQWERVSGSEVDLTDAAPDHPLRAA